MPNFTWYGSPVYRYRNEKGQFLSNQTVWNYQAAGLNAASDKATYLAERLADNSISLPDWQRAMRAEIKKSIGQQYSLGFGGGNLTSSNYGSMGGIAANQYHYLDNFAARIANEEYSEKQIAAISRMYMNSTREAFERANANIRGILDLPAYPGDGNTRCLCIINPEVRILTEYGWQPMLDIKVGDRVLTHRGNWKPVTALVIKPSLPGNTHTKILSPSGVAIQCTGAHRWYSPSGWVSSNDICNSLIPLYTYPIQEETNEKVLSKMRNTFIQSKQANPMQIMSIGMSMRKAQRFSGRNSV